MVDRKQILSATGWIPFIFFQPSADTLIMCKNDGDKTHRVGYAHEFYGNDRPEYLWWKPTGIARYSDADSR